MQLCLTLAEKSATDLNRKVGLYDGRVDLIETRLDFLDRPRLPRLPVAPRSRYVATCRPQREGGMYVGDESTRFDLLGRAAEGGFDWVDLEHDAVVPEPLKGGVGIIRSRHIFGPFPSDLDSELPPVADGDLQKLAVKVHNTSELVQLLNWVVSSRDLGRRHVVIGMDEPGQPSRYLMPFLGSEWTYVCEETSAPAAPGQFSLREGKLLGRAAPDDPLYGVIGQPVRHSLSPALLNGLFRHYQLPGSYVRLPLDTLDPWFDYLGESGLKFNGFSVTLPFKTDVLRFCRSYDSPVASVNTLCARGSNWEGLNTDYPGFLSPLSSRLPLKGISAVVLGNGGVAHTAVGALLEQGAGVTIAGRNETKLASFARAYGCPWVLLEDLSSHADLLVNTTPVGQHPDVDASPLSGSQLDFEVVYDLIYAPEKTRLLKQAKKRGCRIITGMEMFVEQAALQFRAWTGTDPDRMVMRELIRDELEA